MQTILRNNDAIIETKLERLQRLRYQYYIEYCNDINNYKNYTRQKITEYKNIVKDIDKEIEIEKHREKKAKMLESQR